MEEAAGVVSTVHLTPHVIVVVVMEKEEHPADSAAGFASNTSTEFAAGVAARKAGVILVSPGVRQVAHCEGHFSHCPAVALIPTMLQLQQSKLHSSHSLSSSSSSSSSSSQLCCLLEVCGVV